MQGLVEGQVEVYGPRRCSPRGVPKAGPQGLFGQGEQALGVHVPQPSGVPLP